MTVLYDSTYTYNGELTYYGATNADKPVVKVEMDLSSTYPTEVLDLDYGGVLAYETVTAYNNDDRYDGFVQFDDITTAVRTIDISRGKDAGSQVYEHFDAGTLALEIADFTSKFLPDEPTSPYYPNVKPLRQVRVSATWSGATTALFRGFVDRWEVQWQPKQQYAQVKVSATDATKILANFDTTFTGVDGDASYLRVSDMLNDKSWPAAFTDVETTNYFAQLVMDTATKRPLLENLQEYEFTEQGALFVSASGKITWRNLDSANPENDESGSFIFSDTGNTGLVPVLEIQYSIADDAVYNTVSITPTLGTEQVQSDAASISLYRERALIKTDVPLTTDAAADDLATFLLAKQGLPSSRIESVTTDPRLSVTAASASLTADLLTPIDVVRTPPGGTTVTYEMFVSGLRHAITPESWETTFITSYRVSPFTLSGPGVIVIP